MLGISRISKRERRLILTQYAFLTPQLILFVGLTLVPFIVAIPMLFTDQSSFTDPQVNQIGLRNFTAVFRDPSIQADYLPALRRTVIFVAMNYLMIFLFGLSLALLLYEVGFRSGFFTVVYLFTIQAESGKAPIEKILPEANTMPFYRLLNYPFAVEMTSQPAQNVKPVEEMATESVEELA